MLVRITYKGSPIAGAIPVSPAVAEWAIDRLVAECPERRYDYDTMPADYLDDGPDTLTNPPAILWGTGTGQQRGPAPVRTGRDGLPVLTITRNTDFVRVSPDVYVAA